MSTRHRVVCVLLISVLASGCAGTELDDDPACQNVPQRQVHELRFKLKDKGCVYKVEKNDGTDGETIRVRRCDTVKWKVASFKKKIVLFGSGSPFGWSDQGAFWQIDGVVKADADYRDYKYTVRTKGEDCDHDPMIIVGR
jgi:hypothetical protein